MILQKVLLIQACLRKMQVAYPFAGEDLSPLKSELVRLKLRFDMSAMLGCTLIELKFSRPTARIPKKLTNAK